MTPSWPNANDTRTASLLNGNIVSDSESDDAESFLQVTTLTSQAAKNLITKKKEILCLKTLTGWKLKRLLQRGFFAVKSVNVLQLLLIAFQTLEAQ